MLLAQCSIAVLKTFFLWIFKMFSLLSIQQIDNICGMFHKVEFFIILGISICSERSRTSLVRWWIWVFFQMVSHSHQITERKQTLQTIQQIGTHLLKVCIKDFFHLLITGKVKRWNQMKKECKVTLSKYIMWDSVLNCLFF